MAIEESIENRFKSEIKTGGLKLFTQNKIVLSSASDTFVQAFVKVAPPVKVRFEAVDIDCDTFSANCTCSIARKDRLCKHIWATLLCVDQKHPDFISSKCVIEKMSTDTPVEEISTSKSAAKLRNAAYNKERYQKQKERVRELKRKQKDQKTSIHRIGFPNEIEASLTYFSENGFPMPAGPSELILAEAKKRLSLVFHPDRGGSHAEAVELNRNCELLIQFLRRR